jgi:hypothetical protein
MDIHPVPQGDFLSCPTQEEPAARFHAVPFQQTGWAVEALAVPLFKLS